MRASVCVLSVIVIMLPAVVGCAGAPPTPPPDTWSTYSNRWFGYEIRYPPDSSIVETIGGSSTVVYLHAGTEPFAASDHLVLLSASHTESECEAPGRALPEELRAESVRIGDLRYTRYEPSASPVTSLPPWETYTVRSKSVCVAITYATMAPTSAAAEPTHAATTSGDERQQFEGILASFKWNEAP